MKKSNIAELVRYEIKNSLFIQELLKEGLVNHSALARKTLPSIKKQNKNATFDSVLIAVKRFIPELEKESISVELSKIIANSELIMKNDIVEITTVRTSDIFDWITKFSNKIRWDLGEIFFIIQGSGEITFILDKKNRAYFSKLKNFLIQEEDDLALISIREKADKIFSKEVPGYLSLLTTILNDHNINIVEIASTHNQMIFIIKEKDLTKAYDILSNLIKYHRAK